MGIGGENGQAVARRHEDIAPEDHVAVAVAVGGRGEIEPGVALGHVHQVRGMGQVRVRMTPPKSSSGSPFNTVPGSAPSMSSRMRCA